MLCFLLLAPAAHASPSSILDRLPSARTVEVAGHHTCMSTRLGLTKCWGAETGPVAVPHSVEWSIWEQDDYGVRNPDQLSVSSSGNCALRIGKMTCWGSMGPSGAFGVSDNNPLWSAPLAKIAVGKSVDCSITSQGDGGDLSCWDGLYGEIGDPVVLPDRFAGSGDDLVDIAVANSDIDLQNPDPVDEWCAVSGASSHNLFCWSTTRGSAADNPAHPIHHIPGNLSRVRSVSVSHSTVCVVQYDGYIRCWGKTSPAPPDITNPLQLRAGGTSCAITRSHDLKCWGRPLGISNPGKVDWISDLNADHRCLVRHNGRILCWGSDLNGQISGRVTASVPEQDRDLFLDQIEYPGHQFKLEVVMNHNDDRAALSDMSRWINYPSKVINYWQSSRTGLGGWVTRKDLPHSFDTPIGEDNIPSGLNNRYLRACSQAWNELGSSGPACTRPVFWNPNFLLASARANGD